MEAIMVRLEQKTKSFRAYCRLVVERLAPLVIGVGGEDEVKAYEEAAAMTGPYSNHVPLVIGICRHKIDAIDQQPPADRPEEGYQRARDMFQILIDGCEEVLSWIPNVK